MLALMALSGSTAPEAGGAELIDPAARRERRERRSEIGSGMPRFSRAPGGRARGNTYRRGKPATTGPGTGAIDLRAWFWTGRFQVDERTCPRRHKARAQPRVCQVCWRPIPARRSA